MDLNLGDTQFIIQTCLGHGLLRNQTAYVLATAFHETAHTMKPIHEYGGLSYLEGKPYWPYIGRGYVQLTWKANYELAGSKLNQDFVNHPDLLLQPQFAAPILVIGMVEGWFTHGAHKISDYITVQNSNYVGARHIVNGSDQASLIAGYAETYEKLLTEIGYGLVMVKPSTPVHPIEPVEVPPSPVQPVPVVPAPVQPISCNASVQPSVSILEAILNFILAIFRRSK